MLVVKFTDRGVDGLQAWKHSLEVRKVLHCLLKYDIKTLMSCTCKGHFCSIMATGTDITHCSPLDFEINASNITRDEAMTTKLLQA